MGKPAEDGRTTRELRAGEKPMRTLVVDDSDVALRTICSFLKRQQGLEVVATATDGKQALELARTLIPDLVLVDVQMPVMNGLEAATRLRQEFPNIQVIMVTMHDTPELRQACQATGAQYFVPKERLSQELDHVIHQAIMAAQSNS